MRTIAIVALLAVLHLTASVVILQSSPASTKIVAPVAATPILSVPYNSGPYANIAGTGVQWITGTSLTTTTLTFESLFYASCIGVANLKIFAANSFEAYLDGVLVATGSIAGGFKPKGFDIKLSCGNHILTVKVTGSIISQEALTFSIDQDKSACACESTGYWNEATCSCSCINRLDVVNGCKCPSPKVWRDYPTCGCACPTIIYTNPTLSAGAVSIVEKAVENVAEAVDRSFAPYCLSPKYYSQETCKCVCHYQYCPPKHYFDPLACTCMQYIY